jgi:nicotinate-nucleotide adenylyltransferase
LNSSRINRIGIFSGSFDPPHKGHIHISKIFLKKLKLKKLIWTVSKKNPLLKKKYYYSYKERIILSKKISNDIKKIAVSNYDKKYSYQLINLIQKKYKSSEIFFLIGSDNIKSFHKWKKFLQIINVCTLVVINRPGNYNAFKKSFFYKKYSKFMKKNLNNLKAIPQKTWIYINDKGKKISSSNIKNRLYKNK